MAYTSRITIQTEKLMTSKQQYMILSNEHPEIRHLVELPCCDDPLQFCDICKNCIITCISCKEPVLHLANVIQKGSLKCPGTIADQYD